MKRKNRTLFGVFVEWDYCAEPEDCFEACTISLVDEKALEQDGNNLVGRKGNQGYRFNVYGNLEEAIVSAGYSPQHIKFEGLTQEQLEEKDRILSEYDWDCQTGLIHK